VTSQGSPYARFRRALLTKNPGIILPAAAELERVSLEDALKILVVLAEKRHPRFEKAAARFAARVVIERCLEPWEAHRIFALAQAMPESPESLGLYLRRYC
jgi:hypothetical protein